MSKFEIGDCLNLWKDCYGVVVWTDSSKSFLKQYPDLDWNHERGLLLVSNKAGLLHYDDENDEDLSSKVSTFDFEKIDQLGYEKIINLMEELV